MTELTDKLRTCAAGLSTIEISEVLVDAQMEAIIDARRLLTEAAAELEKPIEVRLGEPMAVIAQQVPVTHPVKSIADVDLTSEQRAANDQLNAYWMTDPGVPSLPPARPLGKTVCPHCDSHTTKTVHVKNKRIVLECPVCGHEWRR